MQKRLLIIGSARHGKDTAAEFLKELYGYEFKSSSMAASEIFIYDALKDRYGYKTQEECFEDRVNHRTEWHNLICGYNINDKAALAKEILKTANVYVGMRDNAECEECIRQGLFDLVIGIYDPRKPLEDKRSFNIDILAKSDFIVSNNGTIEQLKNKLALMKEIFAN